MAHKMRMDEIKAMAELEKAKASNVKNQTNVQINSELPFGQGNYGKLMEKLLKNHRGEQMIHLSSYMNSNGDYAPRLVKKDGHFGVMFLRMTQRLLKRLLYRT